jgi:hypothetical protein
MRDCLPPPLPAPPGPSPHAIGRLNLNDIRSLAVSVTFIETFTYYSPLFETTIMLTSRNRTSPHKSQASSKPILAITLAGPLNDFTIRCMF